VDTLKGMEDKINSRGEENALLQSILELTTCLLHRLDLSLLRQKGLVEALKEQAAAIKWFRNYCRRTRVSKTYTWKVTLQFNGEVRISDGQFE